MKNIRGHTWEVTEPTSIQIGKPAHPPSPDVLNDIRSVVSKSGATLVYWFWVSVAGDPPHLGLAVAPNDEGAISRMMRAVDPIWKAYSPDNAAIDVFRLGQTELDEIIVREGVLLFNQSQHA